MNYQKMSETLIGEKNGPNVRDSSVCRSGCCAGQREAHPANRGWWCRSARAGHKSAQMIPRRHERGAFFLPKILKYV